MKLDKEKPMRSTLLGLLSVIIIPILWIVVPYFMSLLPSSKPETTQTQPISATAKPHPKN